MKLFAPLNAVPHGYCTCRRLSAEICIADDSAEYGISIMEKLSELNIPAEEPEETGAEE